ncbi:hypothetical protein PTNB85_09848 [Pyrenophora teres f. teres]|uniref:DUF7719 domain-containing protein n=1 Tax=Pyrenophora teres f. teres TaxID=97479 RepID=A0A6S6VD32_9PLEO|nr:hypothetical protein PTNB85_09848 [Pyrenophora teres f. teres]KAE8868622.1 hypothetical protein PTNB29_02533 [Pyrenophora teres f. teres]CAA9959513.1 hypothetical protein PTMSG1_02930 [Pyrenophora teres f. maculata]CAE7020983.1 hypothetical protein PTTW11_03178 [Pyrenophora teres f. teres]
MSQGNRKERRAKESKSNSKGSGTGFQPSTELDQEGVEMILKHPDFSGPKGKTLFELAEERQRELDEANGTTRTVKAPLASTPSSSNDELPPIGALGDSILYSTAMAALHLTLDVIVYSQYREDILWNEIIWRAATALPIFTVLVYLTHVDFSYRFPILRDVTFFVGSIAAGCYLVYSGNKHGYFHVMKSAPPVGTLWVWSVVEMALPFAAMNAAVVLGYIWWNGFDFF